MRPSMLLATIAGMVAVQAAPAQLAPFPMATGVSMRVTAGATSVGYMCEAFDCTTHTLPVTGQGALLFEMFGVANQPYILFAGDASPGCVTLDWVLGQLASVPPWLVVDIGFVTVSGIPSKCGLETAVLKVPLPNAPIGAQLTMQVAAWSLQAMPAFSRGVTLTIN